MRGEIYGISLWFFNFIFIFILQIITKQTSCDTIESWTLKEADYVSLKFNYIC
jgi:hypothetical protein